LPRCRLLELPRLPLLCASLSSSLALLYLLLLLT
jgi:hypothetical protein